MVAVIRLSNLFGFDNKRVEELGVKKPKKSHQSRAERMGFESCFPRGRSSKKIAWSKYDGPLRLKKCRWQRRWWRRAMRVLRTIEPVSMGEEWWTKCMWIYFSHSMMGPVIGRLWHVSQVVFVSGKRGIDTMFLEVIKWSRLLVFFMIFDFFIFLFEFGNRLRFCLVLQWNKIEFLTLF